AHTFGASLVDDRDRIVTNVNSTYRPPVGVGIHPRKASEHLASVADRIVKTALSTKDSSSIAPDVIAYAAGPGLGPCLRIGATVGRALSSFLKRPLVPVHHGVAHLDIAMSITKAQDRKSTRLNSSHVAISYAVFCLKKKTNQATYQKLQKCQPATYLQDVLSQL